MLVGVRCHWLNPGQEMEVPLAACQQCAASGRNPCGYPLPIIRMVTHDRDPEVVRASATMFGGCAREQGIKANEEWTVAPDEAYTRAYGSVMHLGMEHGYGDGPHHTTEERWRRVITLDDGREAVVTAGLDVLIYEDEAHTKAIIKDYKVVDSIADSAIERKLQHYVPQFSIQRWILEAHHIEVVRVDLSFLTQKGRRTVNLHPDGEPELPSAYLMSSENTERYVRKRLPSLLDSLEGQYAPPLEDPRENWRCASCDVRAICTKLYGKPIPGWRGV